MKNKKGFTLIELLAVIVILAIIALIATPIILNVIEDAKKSAAVDSAYGYIEAIEFNNSMIGVNEKYKDKGITDSDDLSAINNKITVKGNKATEIYSKTIISGKVVSMELCISGYEVEYKDGKAKAKGKCGSENDETEKKEGVITLSANTGSYTYPTSGTFEITENTSDGKLSCTSDNTAVATCSISETIVTVTPGTTSGEATLTIKSEKTDNYKEAQASYVVTTSLGTLSVTANGYDGEYDGEAHGITVTSSGATIKYGTTEGSYPLTSSPTYTDVGEYTVYYQVSKAGYKTVTGSKIINIISFIKNNDSILGFVAKSSFKNDSTETIVVNNVTYTAHVYNFKGNQVWSGDRIFGVESDVGTSSTYAQNMIIVKVDGDLTINKGVTITTHNNTYGGPKGLLLYVTGTLKNNGTITMTARGAKAEGQNVYLWKNKDGTYEYVPSVGASGGSIVTASAASTKKGDVGNPGVGRATGGGGGGAARTYNKTGKGGAGGAGTSYSGGAGGGGGAGTTSSARTGGTGSSVGGAGGAGKWMGGGAGNPGGSGSGAGTNGTGGLLVIYSDIFNNNGNISSDGSTGGTATDEKLTGGGGSGGGSINIFSTEYVNIGSITTTGGAGGTASSGKAGGAGGAGTVTIGSISTGTFVQDS